MIQILFDHIVQKVFFKTFNLASAEAIIQNQSKKHEAHPSKSVELLRSLQPLPIGISKYFSPFCDPYI